MSILVCDHFIYGPVPKKGYAIRAKSKNANLSEAKETLKGYFVPIPPTVFKDMVHEARIIKSSTCREKIFFSRIFQRAKLDEKARTGMLSHTVIIPKNKLSEGLTYKDIDNAMLNFEKNYGIPVGDVSQLELPCEKKDVDGDIANISNIMAKESLMKITDTMYKKPDSKIFIIFKGSTSNDRISLAYGISKLLDIQFKIPISVSTEAPLPLIIDFFCNVVISNFMIELKPDRGWIVVKPYKDTKTITYTPIEKEKLNEKIDGLYRH